MNCASAASRPNPKVTSAVHTATAIGNMSLRDLGVTEDVSGKAKEYSASSAVHRGVRLQPSQTKEETVAPSLTLITSIPYAANPVQAAQQKPRARPTVTVVIRNARRRMRRTVSILIRSARLQTLEEGVAARSRLLRCSWSIIICEPLDCSCRYRKVPQSYNVYPVDQADQA